jgi:hypothetical protein
MENLFSEDPMFRRVQYKKLSDNVREWQQEISAMVAEKLPNDLDLSTVVTFQKVDDEKGYAVGSAVAKDPTSGTSVGVPIIVKAWHLAPLDLFFKDGKVFPLNNDNLAKIFYQSSLGAGLATKKPPPNLSDDSMNESRNPPMGGKYSYSSPLSMINLIGGTLGAEDVNLMKTAVEDLPNILIGFKRHDTFDVLNKYATDKPKPTEQDDANKERTVSTFTIKKDGPNKYRLFCAPDEVYDPVMVSTDRQGLKEFLDMRQAELWDTDADPFVHLDTYGHFTLKSPPSVYGKEVEGPTGNGVDGSGSYGADLGPHKNPFVFDPRQDDRVVRTVDKFGRYGVKDADGVMAKGWVIPNVVDFAGNAKPIKLFLGKALGAMQSRIAGIPLNDDADVTLKADRPDTGKIGVLVHREGKRILSTVPFQVTGVTVYKNLRSLAVNDYQGNPSNLILSPNVNGIVAVDDKQRADLGPLMGPGKNYIISAKMFFVRMPRLCAVSEGPDDFKRKAVEHLDANPVKIAQANGRYIFRGGAVRKFASLKKTASASFGERVAFDFNSLPRYEADFLLRSWGLDQEKTAEVLDATKSHIQLEVHHLNFPGTQLHVKTASPRRRQIIAEMKAPIDDLMKIAANIDDAQSVDAVLSLGFVNEENVSRFAAAKPMLWEVSHMLSKLLLASRLGMDDIPEEYVRAALRYLQKIIKGLGRLKMLESNQEKTSAAKRLPSRRPVGGRLIEGAAPIGFAR